MTLLQSVPAPDINTGNYRQSTLISKRSLLNSSRGRFGLGDVITAQLVKNSLMARVTSREFRMIRMIEQCRPDSIRQYDQIPMRALDLLQQVRLMAPYLAGKTVAFVGDHDCTSLLIGLLGRAKLIPSPKRMLVLDFDERLLVNMQAVARRYSFHYQMDYQLYNVFDPVPLNLAGMFDWFYTNPPYGLYNEGESARLFITRGMELTQEGNGNGCVILPDDSARSWTRMAMVATQQFICGHGWTVDTKLNQLHQYYLDDDQDLASSVMMIKTDYPVKAKLPIPYANREVDREEIAHFYGRSVKPPYPRYIRQDGNPDYNWG